MTLTNTGYIPLVDPLLAMTPTCTSHASLVDLSPAMIIPSTVYGKELPNFLVDLPQAIITTSTSNVKKLPILVKTCINKEKHSGRNISSTLNLANL